MKKLLLTTLIVTAPVSAVQTATAASDKKPYYNMVELSISGSAVDEEGTDPVVLRPKLSANGAERARQIFLADPTVYAEDGKYYMAGTRGGSPAGFTMLESCDLKHWAYARTDSMVLINGNQTYGTQWFWAPQFFKEDDHYLLAYCANEHVAVARANNLTDVYTQPTVCGFDESASNIDPFIFRDDDGKYYMYHVRFGGGNFLWVAEFDPETCQIVPGTLQKCFTNTQAWEATNAYPSSPIMEGPTVVKIDDLYYLFYSANHYLSTDYAVGYATAPSPTGPWTKNPSNPIIHRNIVGEMGSGHGDVFFDADGNMRYVYHVHYSDSKSEPRRARIITFNVDKSDGQPYKITADPESIIIPTQTPVAAYAGVFSGYVRLKPGTYTFSGLTDNGTPATYGEEDGNLVVDGQPYTETENRIVRIVADTRKGTLEITPVTSVEVHSNVSSTSPALTYAGRGVWSDEVTLSTTDEIEYANTNLYFTLNKDENMAYRRIPGTMMIGLSSEGYNSENLRIAQGKYLISADLTNRTFDIAGETDPYRISVFGSSVANGQGAERRHGYAYQYGQQLQTRTEKGRSEYPFYTSGISIGGNTTVALLNRYDDLLRDHSAYVIFGLSMANEGLSSASNKREVFNKFRDNMLTLIDKARADGKIPVVMNNYTNNDYTSSDYNYIRQINLLIHEWDVPSCNTLGAIDDGSCHWAQNFFADGWHPNDNGHSEFMYSMVPSLFDALEQDKPQPKADTTHELTLTDRASITFTPEETLHSFTISLNITAAEGTGNILSFTTVGLRNKTYEGGLLLNGDGTLTYSSPKNDSFTTDIAPFADGKAHYITLTHYYASGRTQLYIDKTLAGSTSENLVPTEFTIGNPDSDKAPALTLSELYFWRAGMCDKEMIALSSGKMLKSSLELYIPMNEEEAVAATADDETAATLPNKAQSLNAVTLRRPDPAGITAAEADAPGAVPVEYITPDGRSLAPSPSPSGIFIVRYSDGSVRKEVCK
ncbi:MAG: family 43 glycosylhydrolase [Bacteroidales bacterium]|nr:family 43 glycosylhydrolase [Bacteroidales bacterium]